MLLQDNLMGALSTWAIGMAGGPFLVRRVPRIGAAAEESAKRLYRRWRECRCSSNHFAGYRKNDRIKAVSETKSAYSSRFFAGRTS
jgi:hypothetical protein